MQYAVLMMAYGGPNSLDDIEPYLLNIRRERRTPPELVEEIRERYALIGGRSPLLHITQAQARALEEHLNAGADGQRCRVYVGMRHWHPYIREAVAHIVQDGLRNVVALCMAPYYSPMSVGAYFKKLQEAIEELGAGLNVIYVESWHDHPLYLQALADKVDAGLQGFATGVRNQVKILFSAHSLPAAIPATGGSGQGLEQGDPYDAQLRQTARGVAELLGDVDWQFCYQSAGARSVNWLGPHIEDVVVESAEVGYKHILVAPIGFVADHVEILYDIDIEARSLAKAAGARLERTEAMNITPLFIEALADITQKALRRSPYPGP